MRLVGLSGVCDRNQYKFNVRSKPFRIQSALCSLRGCRSGTGGTAEGNNVQHTPSFSKGFAPRIICKPQQKSSGARREDDDSYVTYASYSTDLSLKPPVM